MSLHTSTKSNNRGVSTGDIHESLPLISTTAAILLLGAGAVSAQNTIKTDETPGAPAAQQNAPPEKIAPAAKSGPIKTPEKTGQAVPTVPESANKQQTTEKAAPAGERGQGFFRRQS